MIKRTICWKDERNQIGTDALRAFSKLLSDSTDSNLMFKCLEELRALLDCLVLGTGEYGTAVLRIKNAQRFFASDEFGAAKFEVRLLKGGLVDQLRERSGPIGSHGESDSFA